jgi:hypothetical protein
MTRDEKDRNYEIIRNQPGMKEYIFMTSAGYRTFFVLGKDLKDAENNFMRIDLLGRNGFSLEDLPVRLEYNKENCKDWSMDTFRDNNENKTSKNIPSL